MYNWNFPLLLLLCVLNTIEADVRLVDGREYSHERSLRSFYPDIRSSAHIRLRKWHQEIPTRKEYRDISLLQENRRESNIRSEQSRHANEGFSRFKPNYDHLGYRQRKAEKNHYFRLIRNRVLSANRFDENERHTLNNFNNFRTRSDGRMRNANERTSVNRFNVITRGNTNKIRHQSDESKDRIIRSSKDVRGLSGVNREMKNMRDVRNRNEIVRTDEHRERRASSIKSRQIERVMAPAQEKLNDRIISRQTDNKRIIRSDRENIVVRREREIRNENSNRYELRINRGSLSRTRDLSSRPSERTSFTNNRELRSINAMGRDSNLRHNERNIRENDKQRSSENVRDVLRSLERMNMRGITETTVRIEKAERAARDARTRKATQHSMNTEDSFSSSRIQRDSNRRIVRQEAHRPNSNQRSPLRENQRNRYIRESDRTRNNIDRHVQIKERSPEVRHSRSAERYQEISESLRENSERNTLRSNEDRASERQQQRAGYTNTVRRTRFDDRQIRISNSEDNIDQERRFRQNVNRNRDRRSTIDNSANRRMIQVVTRRDTRESRMFQQFENVEKNRRMREYVSNFDISRKTMSTMDNEQYSLFSWQAAFYALQAIYICSIILKVYNMSDSTKKKTRCFSWLSEPVNKID